MKSAYPKPVIIIHWITFILAAVAYLSAGNPAETGWLGQVHVSAGISIFMLFFIRLGLIFIYRRSIPHNQAINKYQKKIFEIVRFALYLSLFAVPLAGWLALSSLTGSFTVLSFNLPLLNSLLGAEYIGGLHEFLGSFFIAIAGLHACAALMHHFIFKDNVLKSMLIRKRRD